MEHFGKKSDGFCLTLLLQALSKIDTKGRTASGKGSSFHWTAVTDGQTAETLRNAVLSDFGCAWFD